MRGLAHKISFLDSGCGLIPGCDECTDGLLCKTCKQSFIPVEYERNRKIIIRCTRSCPVGFNITSRQGYSRICIRTELGMLYSKHAIFVASIEYGRRNGAKFNKSKSLPTSTTNLHFNIFFLHQQ